jgi:glycosyltransferase involved in cell wall biosynthesis
MNILQIVKYFYPSKGGMESVVKDLSEGLCSFGKNINITVYTNSNFLSFKTTKLVSSNLIVIFEKTILFFKSQPVRLRYKSLVRLISEADIIHHHFPYPNIEFWLLFYRRKLLSKKLIITWHANVENSRWSILFSFYKPVIKRLLRLADKIVVTSPNLFDNSKLLFEFKEKVVVIPLSYNPTISSISIPRKFPTGRKFKILFVGKLRKYKGLKYLIEAVKDLDVQLYIIGDGEERENLLSLVRFYDINKKVFFFNNVSNDDLRKFYFESDLFILPSINEAEAFGIVQLEAMANGLPVINTNLNSGVPFVSIDKYSGYTVIPSDSSGLKYAISEILNNPKLYEEFSINALNRAKDFTIDAMVSSYLKIYLQKEVT